MESQFFRGYVLQFCLILEFYLLNNCFLLSPSSISHSKYISLQLFFQPLQVILPSDSHCNVFYITCSECLSFPFDLFSLQDVCFIKLIQSQQCSYFKECHISFSAVHLCHDVIEFFIFIYQSVKVASHLFFFLLLSVLTFTFLHAFCLLLPSVYECFLAVIDLSLLLTAVSSFIVFVLLLILFPSSFLFYSSFSCFSFLSYLSCHIFFFLSLFSSIFFIFLFYFFNLSSFFGLVLVLVEVKVDIRPFPDIWVRFCLCHLSFISCVGCHLFTLLWQILYWSLGSMLLGV